MPRNLTKHFIDSSGSLYQLVFVSAVWINISCFPHALLAPVPLFTTSDDDVILFVQIQAPTVLF